jgi:hypothetical protein
MRVFVSSSFQDLREHRAAAIRVLRQLGHEVLAMEDMTAGSVAPLGKVIEMVDRSEAYVGIFAWRYGYVPSAPMAPPPSASVAAAGAVPGETSITHYEYLRAVERRLPVLAFLLDETSPWPPQLIDGFDSSTPHARTSADAIRALRFTLQQERVVSWFTTPSDLEARVSAAITTAGLTRQLDLQRASVVDLLRLLDYPSDFVPVITRDQRGDSSMAERVDVLDKAALNARLARSYLVELMDRARIS